jgi:tRNA(fMet)-specific endonuclease VapC
MADNLLFNSTFLIDLFRDGPRPEEYLEDLPDDTAVFTHAMVRAEVLVGLQNAKELGKFDRLFRRFELLHPNEADSAATLISLSKLHLSHKIGFPDCSIAATAVRLALPVVTLNVRHFRLFPDLKVIKPN